jgi:hypothetical protein
LNLELLKLHLENEHFSENNLKIEIGGKNILMKLILQKRHHTLKYMLSHSKITKDIVSFISSNKQSVLGYALTNDKRSAIELLNSNKLTKDIFAYQEDNPNKKNIIYYGIKKLSELEFNNLVLSHRYFSQDILFQKTFNKYSIDWILEKYPLLLRNFPKMKWFTPEIFSLADSNGINVFVNLISLVNDEKILESLLVDNKNLIKDLFYLKNNLCDNIITFLPYANTKLNPEIIINKILELEILTQEMIESANNKGENILFLIGNKYQYNTTFNLIVQKYMSSKLLNLLTENNETVIMSACCDEKYSVEKFNLIMDSGLVTEENFTQENINGVNLFTLACSQGNIELVKLIYDHNLFNSEMFNIIDFEGYNCLMRSLYSKDIFSFILESNFFEKSMFYKISLTGENLLFLSALSNDNVTKIILSSDYLTREMLEMPSKNNHTVLSILSDKQTDILKLILKNKHFNIDSLGITNKIDKSNVVQYHFLENNMSLIKIFIDEKIDIGRFLFSDNLSSLYLKLCENENFLNIILDNDVLTQDILKKVDNEKNNILFYIFDICSIDICKKLDAKNLLQENILCEQNNFGDNILHISTKSLTHSYEKINLLLDNDSVGDNLMTCKNKEELIPMFCESIDKTYEYAKHDKCTEKVLLTLIPSIGASKISMLTPLMIACAIEDNHLIDLLLANKNMCNDIFNFKNNDNISAISISAQSEHLLFKKMFESQFFSHESIKYNFSNNQNILQILVSAQHHENLKLVLESNYNLTELFKYSNGSSNKNIISCATSNESLFNKIYTCKYFSKKMLFEYDHLGHNAIMSAFATNINVSKTLIDSPYWENLKYTKDSDNDFLLLFLNLNPELLETLVDDDKIDNKMLSMTNKFRENWFHSIICENNNLFDSILKTDLDFESLLYGRDKNGNTPLHNLLIKNVNTIRIKKLVDMKIITNKLMEIKNNEGKNIFSLALEKNSKVANYLIKSNLVSKLCLNQKDSDQNNVLMYCIRYNPQLLKKVLSLKDINRKLFSERNNKNWNYLMHASRYSAKSINVLRESEYFKMDDMWNGHTEHGSVLTVASRYNHKSLEHLLNINNIPEKIIKTVYKSKSFVDYACLENEESVKILINSEYDFTDLFFYNDIKYDLPIILACKDQPNAIKYILDSKYGSYEMITVKSLDNRSLIFNAYDTQPLALAHILNSKHCTSLVLNTPDINGYKLYDKLKIIYPTLIDCKDIFNRFPHMYVKNIKSGDNDPMECNICYEYRASVLFYPCCHTCCVTCSMKLSKCHMCRGAIDDKKLLFDEQ